MNAARIVRLEQLNNSPLHKSAGIAENQFVLLFQGRLSKDRGVKILLEAVDKIPANWSIVFMGAGPLVEEVDRMISLLKDRRPSGQATIAHIMPAPYHELAQWTAGADLGVIPYVNVGPNHLYCTPNKLWEYPNAGVPILASSMVEMSKMIEKYQTGMLLPREFTSSDIVDILEQTDRAKLDQLVEKCWNFNKEEHWEKYEKRLVSLYNEIVQ